MIFLKGLSWRNRIRTMFVYKAREGSRNIPLHIEVSDIDFNRAYIPRIPDRFYFVAHRTPRSQTLPLQYLTSSSSSSYIPYPISQNELPLRDRNLPFLIAEIDPAFNFHPKFTPPQIQAKKNPTVHMRTPHQSIILILKPACKTPLPIRNEIPPQPNPFHKNASDEYDELR